jgi:uroporphyrin-III C-methyltransferase
MTRSGALVASRGADTEVFYMAGRQLAALSRRLLGAGWAGDTPVAVVSRAGWPDQHGSDHRVDTLAEACVLHGGRPTVVIVGVGASRLCATGASPADAREQALPADPRAITLSPHGSPPAAEESKP